MADAGGVRHRASGLRLELRVGVAPDRVLEALARHRANAAAGREACEHWGPGSSVSRVRLGDGSAAVDWAVKWHHRRGPRRAWLEGLRGSRARRAVRGAAWLAAAGLRAPEVVAWAERRRPWGIEESYLVAGFLADAEPLPAASPRLRSDRQRRRRAVTALGDLVGRLHGAGLDHGDLKHSNLMLHRDGSWSLIDLDALEARRRVSLRRRARALAQLEAYAVDLYPWLPRSDRTRFFAAYLRHAPQLAARRRKLLARVSRRVARRLASWARQDRSDHYHFPLAPRGAPGRPRS